MRIDPRKTILFLSTISCCSFTVLGDATYQNPVIDIHYDSDGKAISSNPLQYNGTPDDFSTPSSDAYESLRTLGTSGSSNSFVQKRLFNTSVALTVPLFSFTLPQKSSQGSTIDLANQAIFGLFSLLVVVLVFTVPILFTGTRPTERSLDGDGGPLNHLMNSKNVLNFMGADMTNKIGLDTTKCLQKTICEAHRYPKRHGMLSTPFQIFFPPPSEKMSSEKASIFQLAARDGKMSKKDCGKTYNCFFDVLDLATYLIDWWQYSNNNNNNNQDYVQQL